MFFSTSEGDDYYEKGLWDELYAFVTYVKVPYETVMKMPVYVRKYWIDKHNEVNGGDSERNSDPRKMEWSAGMAMNSIAKNQIEKEKNGAGFIR